MTSLAATVRKSLNTSRDRQRLSIAYAVIAALLVPWIVLLYLTQPYTGTVHALGLVSVGVPVVVVTGLLFTARLLAVGSPRSAVTATFTAAAASVMEWFHLLTGTSRSEAVSIALLAYVLPVIGLLIWIATRPRHFRPVGLDDTRLPARGRSWVPPTLVFLALVTALLVAHLATVTAPVRRADHLRLVWTGLDCFEFLGLVCIAVTLRKRSLNVVFAGACTAALLLCDAWFNVSASSGAARVEALGMAGVELPIAMVSFVIAWHEAVRCAKR